MAKTKGISQRQDGRWTVKFEGRQTTCKTETEAKRKLKELKAQAKAMDIDVAKRRVEDAVEEWLEYHQCHVKPSTYDRIEQSWRNHVKGYVGHIQMGALKETDVEKMLTDMTRKNYSHSTVKKAYEVLSASFKYFEDRRLIQDNPIKVVKVPAVNKKPKGEIACYTEEELARIYKEAVKTFSNGTPVYRQGWALVLLGNTGMRAGELFGLKKKNVDLDNREIRIRGNCVIVKDRGDGDRKTKIIEQETPKTDDSIRTVKLNDMALKAVEELIKLSGESPYLVTTRNGKPTQPPGFDRSFRRVLTAAGFEEDKIYGVHALRHSFATCLIRKGVNPKVVSEMLGHSDVRVTLSTYTHALKSDYTDAVAKLDTVDFS